MLSDSHLLHEPVGLSAVVRRDGCYNVGGHGPGAFGGSGAVSQRVRDDDQRQFGKVVGPGYCICQTHEIRGDNNRGGLTHVLKIQRVEHTARRAGPSKRYAGDEEVRLRSHLADDVRFGRPSRSKFGL